MTKKEIIDKVYDDYLKDYGRVGYIGMNSIEKACKSEFEKNGIEYDHYDVKEALESKSHYNIVNAYIKGYSDTREGMTSSSIRDFMIQYKQGLDAGDIEYKDAEFERVAEIFKRYDKYETFNKESKDAIDGLRKDVDMYLSERSSDKESVQNAYKAINAYIYGDSSFGNLSEQVKDIDPADMKEAFNKVIEDNDYLKSWLSIMENPNRNDCSFILNDEYINPDMRDNLNEIYDKCIKDNIGDISKEPKEIQMAAKMHSFMEDYDKAYRDINDYLEGKTTKLNEGKNMNQYAVTRAFENVIIRHDGDLVITDKHVEIGKNYDIPRTNSFPENDYQLTDALREVRERVADSLAKDFSDDKETQEQFKEMYSSLHGSWSVRQGDPHERDSLDDRYSAFSDDEMKEANKAAADAFLKVIKCENVQKLLADIKEGDIKHNLDVMMHSPDCNFYDLINAYEMSGAREQIGNMVTEACKNADDPTNVRPEEVGLTADEIRGITKIEEIINAEEELASTFDVMNDYMEGDNQDVTFASNVVCSSIKKIIVHSPDTVSQLGYTCGFPETLVLKTDLLLKEEDVAAKAHEHINDNYIKHFSIVNPGYKEIDGIVYTNNEEKLVACSMEKEHVVIPDGVKTIGSSAFANCMIKSVIIPDSVTEIRGEAFKQCQNLESVIFGKNVKIIGRRAFSQCYNIKHLSMPEGLRIIRNDAFAYSGLESIKLNEGLKKIGENVFFCTNIKSIRLPETIKCIEDKCLSGSIENVYIPIFLKGILDICAAGTYHPDTNDDKITRLQCGERYLYMPQHLNSLTYAKASNQIQAFFLGNLKSRPEMWSYANTAICRENLALLEYFHFRAEGAKEYIKKFSKGILSRFIQEGDEKQAVEFVKTGFVSQNTLKEMMLRAKENNMVSLQAYILEQLNVDKANLENFRI